MRFEHETLTAETRLVRLKFFKILLEYIWQFFARFLYGASVHLNLDRRTPVRLSNRVIVFSQSKRSEWFRRILYFISLRFSKSDNVLKEIFHALAVHLSSYGCTWEVGRALEKLEKHSASPRTTQTFLSCSPNFPRASITR